MKKTTFYEAKKRIAEALESAKENILDTANNEVSYYKGMLNTDENGNEIKDDYYFKRYEEAIALHDEIAKQMDTLIEKF